VVSIGQRSPSPRFGYDGSAPRERTLTVAECAWLSLLPCALVLLGVVVLLGPPLGRALLEPTGADVFWRHYVVERVVRPEPTEHARYLLALLGPLLLAGCAFALARRTAPGHTAVRWLTLLSRAALVAFVVVCITYQERHLYDASYTGGVFRTTYFTPVTLVAATVFALLAATALGHPPTRDRLVRAARETPRRRAAAFAVAGVFAFLWLLSAFNTESSATILNGAVRGNIPFWIDESFAILDGHAPLVDFHAQYGQLWSYVAAGTMSVLGASLTVYALTMLAGASAALASLFATFRIVTRSSVAAVALFVPLVATGFFMESPPLDNRYGPSDLFSLFPMRYMGPYVLLWLLVRRVRRRSSAAPVALFAVAGLVAINNVEFGVPALVATIVALLLTLPERSRAGLLRLAGGVAAGLACAVALVAALTLAVAGSLPHFGMLTTFPRIYGVEGFGLLPAPPLGLHLVVYLTFAAALVVALLRSPRADPALTAALAWAGLFGLGAGSYFMGRSHPHVLIDLFSAWSLALGLLVVVVVHAHLRRASRWPTVSELLVLTGLGLAVCSLAQTPTPWSQVARLSEGLPASEPDLLPNVTRRVIAQMTHRGQHVAVLVKEGHRFAYEIGIDDVTPYANIESMLTIGQWREMLVALRAAHGTELIVPRERLLPENTAWLQRAGYRATREAAGVGLIEFDR